MLSLQSPGGGGVETLAISVDLAREEKSETDYICCLGSYIISCFVDASPDMKTANFLLKFYVDRL